MGTQIRGYVEIPDNIVLNPMTNNLDCGGYSMVEAAGVIGDANLILNSKNPGVNDIFLNAANVGILNNVSLAGDIDLIDGLIKDQKNDVASALSGTQKDIEIDIAGVPYYFTVYLTKA